MKAVYFLAAASALALAAAACSSDPSTLGGPGQSTMGGYNNPQQPTTPVATSTAPPSGSIGAPPAATTPADNKPPPGIIDNAAKTFFVSQVYPSLMSTCGGCHAPPGSAGAPVYLSTASAGDSYTTVEGRGYISPSSMLLKKGAHEGPALTTAQQSLVQQWLTLETSARGNNVPDNLLSKLGNCLDQTKFTTIALQNLRTTPRTNENPNRCTGCNKAICQDCHEQGEYAMHSNFSKLGTDTFLALQGNGTSPEGTYLISKYITTNGTTLIPSTAIADKATVTQGGTAYSHPMFTVTPAMAQAITDFANDAITKYDAKTCGQ